MVGRLGTRIGIAVVLIAFSIAAPAARGGRVTGAAAACANPAGFNAPNATIGIAYGFLGNSWRQTMKKALDKVAANAVACHQLKAVVTVSAETSATEQIAQLNTLILKHVNAILIDAVSSTATDAVINKAVAAGIPVVNFDTEVLTDKAYRLTWDLKSTGALVAQYIANRLHGHGNVLTVRGVAGVTIEQDIYDGMRSVFGKYPQLKTVATVYGNWDDATAESAVARILPSLPKIDAVWETGGEGGIVAAFEAAHRTVPVMVGSNRGSFLRWWWAHRTTYDTFSISAQPECAVVAFYIAQYLLQGVSVPKLMLIPLFTITKANLALYKDTPVDVVANPDYDVLWVRHNVLHLK
jgi:ribose transport system substrate-binding protein